MDRLIDWLIAVFDFPVFFRPGSTGTSPTLILPKFPRLVFTVNGSRPAKNIQPLSINSCVQTTETRLTLPKNADASTSAHVVPRFVSRPFRTNLNTLNAGKNCQQVQAGGQFCDLSSDIRSSGAQTIALLTKPPAGLLIDAYTQTDLLGASRDGFSLEERNELFQYIEEVRPWDKSFFCS